MGIKNKSPLSQSIDLLDQFCLECLQDGFVSCYFFLQWWTQHKSPFKISHPWARRFNVQQIKISSHPLSLLDFYRCPYCPYYCPNQHVSLSASEAYPSSDGLPNSQDLFYRPHSGHFHHGIINKQISILMQKRENYTTTFTTNKSFTYLISSP